MYQHVNETVCILSNVACWIHSYWYFGRSWKRPLLFFTAATVLGTISEAVAILFTGGYQYEGFWWYIGPVPLFIAIGWGAAFYFPYVLSETIIERWAQVKYNLVFFGLCAGLIALFIDLWYDPVAVALGWWTWTNPGPYYRVPTSNFIGWLFFAGLFCPLFRVIDGRQWSFRRKWVTLLLALPLVFGITAAVSFPFF